LAVGGWQLAVGSWQLTDLITPLPVFHTSILTSCPSFPQTEHCRFPFDSGANKFTWSEHSFSMKLKEDMKIVFTIIILFFITTGCKKSFSSGINTAPPFSCTTDLCTLTYYKWGIVSETVSTDLGTYTYTSTQLAGINWATFQFNPDSSCLTYGGSRDSYSYDPSSKKMVLTENLLPLLFDVAFPSNTSLNLMANKIQMHPRTDSSVEANYAINSIAGGLHTDFGVDTSRIHFIQPVFSYKGY
jgi:hypothetical protein